MKHRVKSMKIGSVVTAIALAMLLTTCGGTGGPTPPEGASPGITIDPTDGLLTSEFGGTDSFTVVLNSEPAADVTIGIYCNDTNEATVSPSSLLFTPGNWDTPQTVTVSGVDDSVVDGNQDCKIVTEPAMSSDPDYSGLDADDVSFTNLDDDTAGITINPNSGLVTTEVGGTDSFVIVLNTQPYEDVTIGLSSDDTTEGTVNPTSLTFTPVNWDIPQIVTVSGVDDQVVDVNQTYTIVTAPAVSTDPDYNGLDADDVSCTNIDDDAATNADLTNLTLSSGSLLPVFAVDTTTYSAYIANGTDSITVTPTTSDINAKCEVRVDGGSWTEVLSGSPSPSLDMTVGTNTVEVRVTAEDSTTTNTYTIDVDRVNVDVLIVPDDYGTIQAAIDATTDSDTVLVRQGTYTENIAFPTVPTDRSITVRSTHGADSTTIDGGGSGSVVTYSTSNASSELNGFTITNGDATATGGGGIYCNGASPTITNCNISGNSASSVIFGQGGGMYNENASPTVTHCTFSANTAFVSGGGMHNENASPTVAHCTFSANDGGGSGGGMYNAGDNAGYSPTVTSCTFSGNEANTGTCGGMYNANSSPTLVNCIFDQNDDGDSYGYDMVNDGNSAKPTVTNCTFYNGLTPSMDNLSSAKPTVTNCIFWGGLVQDMIRYDTEPPPVVTYSAFELAVPSWAGTGNIVVLQTDPLFVSTAGGDFHLKASSPCIDAGNNSAPFLPDTDIDGDARRIDDPAVDDTGNGTAPIVDMGADEYSP